MQAFIIRRRQVRPAKDLYLFNIGVPHIFTIDIYDAMKWEDEIDVADLPKSIYEDKTLDVVKVLFQAEIVDEIYFDGGDSNGKRN